MDEKEIERLTKTHHTAQFLLGDLREVQAKTDSVAVEVKLMLGYIGQVTEISRVLGRLVPRQ